MPAMLNVEQLFRELGDIKAAVDDVQDGMDSGFEKINGRLRKAENQLLIIKTFGSIGIVVAGWLHWPSVLKLFGVG